MSRRIIVTGSSGLIGSAVVRHFGGQGWTVHGLDNNQRAVFFGPAGDTRWNQKLLEETVPSFVHHELDIRDRAGLLRLFKELRPDAVVHAAAQPSHDRAADIPLDDFDTNAVGTINLLEATRATCAASPFIFMSTNKVYGDLPNRIPLTEGAARYDFDGDQFKNGIPETLGIDQCLHSVFGASKVAADIMVQEYGRYYGIQTCCLRGGCLTGPSHSGVQLHGFLSYLVRCNLKRQPYTVFGYKGKQVRDNVHAVDVARFIAAFVDRPSAGRVYNIGGGKSNSCSVLEAFELVEDITGIPMRWEYTETARTGDHVCYYSDLSSICADYPEWRPELDLPMTLNDIVQSLRIVGVD